MYYFHSCSAIVYKKWVLRSNYIDCAKFNVLGLTSRQRPMLKLYCIGYLEARHQMSPVRQVVSKICISHATRTHVWTTMSCFQRQLILIACDLGIQPTNDLLLAICLISDWQASKHLAIWNGISSACRLVVKPDRPKGTQGKKWYIQTHLRTSSLFDKSERIGLRKILVKAGSWCWKEIIFISYFGETSGIASLLWMRIIR